VLERIRHNAGLKLLSLALAVAAWAYLHVVNPAIAARFDQQMSVPIVVTSLPGDETARFNDKRVLVTIATSRDANLTVRPDELRAVLNVAGRGPGVYSVPISIVGPKLDVKAVSPSSVTLEVVRVDARRVPVSVRYGGDPRGAVVVDNARVTPPTVLIRGANDELARIVSARVDVPFPAQPQAVDAMQRAVPVTARGDEVSGVVPAPNFVRVRVRFVAADRGS
jgi:YbbR domain-containing protein